MMVSDEPDNILHDRSNSNAVAVFGQAAKYSNDPSTGESDALIVVNLPIYLL